MTRYWTSQTLLLTVLVFLQTSLARADSIPEVVAKAKPAIVEIVTDDAPGKSKTIGTGIFATDVPFLKLGESTTAIRLNPYFALTFNHRAIAYEKLGNTAATERDRAKAKKLTK